MHPAPVRVLSLIPPMTQLNTPYPSTAYLTGFLRSRGVDAVLRVDVQGAETVRKLVPNAILIFMTVDNEQELERRLRERKTETAEELALRIATARKELQRVEAFDFVVVNADDHLDQAVDTIQAIIASEHQRVIQKKVIL